MALRLAGSRRGTKAPACVRGGNKNRCYEFSEFQHHASGQLDCHVAARSISFRMPNLQEHRDPWYAIVVHDHYWRNFVRSLKFIWTTPTTFVGVLLSALSIFSVIEKWWTLSFSEYVIILIDRYRLVAHYPFDLAARYLDIHVPIALRDFIVLYLALSVCLGRAFLLLREGGPKIVTIPTQFEPRARGYRSNHFYNQVKGRTEYDHKLFWIYQDLFLKWHNFADKMSNIKALPKIIRTALYYFFVILCMPFLLIYICIFDDMLILEYWNFIWKGEPYLDPNYYETQDEHSSEMPIRSERHIEISIRFLIVAQLGSISFWLLLLTAF